MALLLPTLTASSLSKAATASLSNSLMGSRAGTASLSRVAMARSSSSLMVSSSSRTALRQALLRATVALLVAQQATDSLPSRATTPMARHPWQVAPSPHQAVAQTPT